MPSSNYFAIVSISPNPINYVIFFLFLMPLIPPRCPLRNVLLLLMRHSGSSQDHCASIPAITLTPRPIAVQCGSRENVIGQIPWRLGLTFFTGGAKRFPFVGLTCSQVATTAQLQETVHSHCAMRRNCSSTSSRSLLALLVLPGGRNCCSTAQSSSALQVWELRPNFHSFPAYCTSGPSVQGATTTRRGFLLPCNPSRQPSHNLAVL